MRRKTSKKATAKRSRKKSGRAVTGPGASNAINAYLLRRNADLKPVADQVRALIKEVVPRSKEVLNAWGIPTFEASGPFCFILANKSHLTFGFARGKSLTDPGGLLEGAGKNIRHVKLRTMDQTSNPQIKDLLKQAAALNRRQPLSSAMRAKKRT